MADQTPSLIDEIRSDLAAARALVRTRLRAAQHAEREAVRARAEAQAAAIARPPQLAAELAQQLRDVAYQHASTLAVTGTAAAAAAATLPVAARADWSQWSPQPVPVAQPPPPLRLGDIHLPGTDPVPALVPLLDHAHVRIEGERGADSVCAALLLRALGTHEPGRVHVTGYDPEHLGGGLAAFAPLAPAGLLTFVGPGGLTGLLDTLVEHIRRINETVLAGAYPSLHAMALATGRRPEPWRLAVLLGDTDPDRGQLAQLERILRAGPACGVHLIMRGVTATSTPLTHTVTLADGYATVGIFGHLPIRVEAPPTQLVRSVCTDMAAEVAAGPIPTQLRDLLPRQEWTESSTTGLVAPLGDGADGRQVSVTLSDYPPHALIGGPSGTGKTNLLYAWIAALATRYGPAELEFYLLDFKEGVSFARFAAGRADPSWLPQVRLVGVNVNNDREFGLALLRFLGECLRGRSTAAKHHDVSTLEELRRADPGGHWPRIVAVIDEFQALIAGRDALTGEAVTLLEDLARRGRSQGIHLILSSQDVSGIEALWGRSGLIAQFTLRIALPKARRILPDTNPAADAIPRFHAVVNADAGALDANQVVRLPAASDRSQWEELQRRLWQRRPAGLAPPRCFDGDAVPQLADSAVFTALAPADSPSDDPVVLLGAAIDVVDRSATLALRRSPGRNLAIVGTRTAEACAILGAAALSLARQFPGSSARTASGAASGSASFVVACLDDAASEHARGLCASLGLPAPITDPAILAEQLSLIAGSMGERPQFLFVYAVDAATSHRAARATSASASASGGGGGGGVSEQLRHILHNGPERRTHVFGWWRSVARLRDDLGGIGARLDTIGAWVALDIHGGDLAPLYPHPGGPVWYPRPWRGLFFDRAEHRSAEVIVPYGGTERAGRWAPTDAPAHVWQPAHVWRPAP